MILSSPGHSKTSTLKRNKNKHIKSKLCLPRTLSGASLFTFQYHILSCRVNFCQTDHIKDFSYNNINEFLSAFLKSKKDVLLVNKIEQLKTEYTWM